MPSVAAAPPIPSIRKIWTMYKRILIEGGFGPRDLALARESFYAGARGVFHALAFHAERDRLDEVNRVIARQGRQNKSLMRLAPRKRRH